MTEQCKYCHAPFRYWGFPEPYNEKYIPSRAKVFPDKKLLQIETDSWDFHNDEDCIDTVTVPINHCPKCGRKL